MIKQSGSVLDSYAEGQRYFMGEGKLEAHIQATASQNPLAFPTLPSVLLRLTG